MDAEYIVQNKFHYKFFLEYFQSHGNGDHGAQTIVIEEKYISKAFLHDYSEYYSLCFQQYSRYSKRIHFFKSNFCTEDLLKEIAISTQKGRKFLTNKAYIGYIVVKNLPNINIGAVVLNTYPRKLDKDRNYTVKKIYPVNILGISLSVKSLAFQEQDKVISACATSAIWSAFHKTSELFQTSTPTPNEITKSAKNLFVSSGRLFPNLGLDHTQIGNTIDSIGLEFELRNNEDVLDDLSYVKSFIYSYIRSGIPVLLGIDIHDRGKHLITITGYRQSREIIKKTKEIALFSEGINEFYAHDDQVGPFSRLLFNEKSNTVITSWWKDDSGKSFHEAEVVSIFVPVYHKIRLNFDNVLSEIYPFDALLRIWSIKKMFINWDVFILPSNHYKSKLSTLDSDRGFTTKIRRQNLPKYIWIARAYIDNKLQIEFIFDSTDIAGGHNCLMVNIISFELEEFLRNEFYIEELRSSVKEIMGINYLRLFLNELGFIDGQANTLRNMQMTD